MKFYIQYYFCDIFISGHYNLQIGDVVEMEHGADINDLVVPMVNADKDVSYHKVRLNIGKIQTVQVNGRAYWNSNSYKYILADT